MTFGTVLFGVLILLIVVVVARSVALIPQGEAAVIERLGRYTRTVSGGLTLLIPFIDRIRAKVDTRERVFSFPPQAVITQDNLTVAIDTVVTFQVNEPERAIYGVDNYIVGVEQISTATLRDVVGGMTLEETLTSREVINRRLRGELDAATTKWGLRISRVELKAIDPPPSIQQSMEMQMKADREKRAMILNAEGQREADIKTAEGEKQAKILAAEGEKHAAILAAEAERQAVILRAEGERAGMFLRAQGEARAIQKVNAAIRSNNSPRHWPTKTTTASSATNPPKWTHAPKNWRTKTQTLNTGSPPNPTPKSPPPLLQQTQWPKNQWIPNHHRHPSCHRRSNPTSPTPSTG